MMVSSLLRALLLALVSSSAAIRPQWWRHVSGPRLAAVTNRTQWITQPIDHFNRDLGSFQQRYLVNASFFDGSGPIFLCVGGEGPGFSEDVVVSGTEHAALMIIEAKKHNALVLALEHRYYGESIPTADLSTKSLRYLSSPQALEDLAGFVAHINAQYSLSASNRWITFGGSYPGMMASFARVKYPHLVWASVASSAPVQAVLNMQGYMDVMSDSFLLEDVGGSAECHSSIRQAFADLGSNLTSKTGRAALYQLFPICEAASDPLATAQQQSTFANDLSFMFPAQGNDPLCEGQPGGGQQGCDIRATCTAFMTNTSIGEPLERLAALFKVHLGAPQPGQPACSTVSYEDEVVKPLVDTSLAGGTARVWTYQTCTEYGFYQTCDPGTRCIFTSAPHLNSLQGYLEQCRLAFGLSAEAVAAAVDASNTWSGGWHPGASRVLYVNGQVDPWRSQGVLPNNTVFGKVQTVGQEHGEQSGALMVEGASHHYWTHDELRLSEPIVQARKSISSAIRGWLDM